MSTWIGKIRWLLTIPTLGLISCASLPEGSPGDALTPGSEPVKVPFLVVEASLPSGFPPPGPVDQIILKRYPAYRAAQVTDHSGKTDDGNAMFWPLFNHIKQNDIAMTAPVEMTYPQVVSEGSGPVSMAFLYGDPTVGKKGPADKVEVVDLPARTVLSIGVRGRYTPERFREALATLDDAIKADHRFKVASPPRFLGYNSPFVLWCLRYGEVQVPVEIQGHGK